MKLFFMLIKSRTKGRRKVVVSKHFPSKTQFKDVRVHFISYSATEIIDHELPDKL